MEKVTSLRFSKTDEGQGADLEQVKAKGLGPLPFMRCEGSQTGMRPRRNFGRCRQMPRPALERAREFAYS
jgi:hypothetical protein